MTTHFTSGVTNVVTGGTGEKLKQQIQLNTTFITRTSTNTQLVTGLLLQLKLVSETRQKL